MARTKIYLNQPIHSALNILKEGLNLKSFGAVVEYLYKSHSPSLPSIQSFSPPQPAQPEPVWIDRKAFLTPIQPGAFTHINQHLPLEYESIILSQKGKPFKASNIVREELPYDEVGKARIRYKNTSPSGPVKPIEEKVYTAEDYPLSDDEVIRQFNEEKEEKMKNRFDLRSEK